jgi:hypothetical protein
MVHVCDRFMELVCGRPMCVCVCVCVCVFVCVCVCMYISI